MVMPVRDFTSQSGRGFKKGLGVLAIGLLSVVLIAGGILWLRDSPKANNNPAVSPQPVWVGNFRPIPVMPPQPALTDFPCKPVREASELNPTELVLGVEIGE